MVEAIRKAIGPVKPITLSPKAIEARANALTTSRPLVGNRVSHANNKTKRRTLPNLQKVRAVVDGSTIRLLACTRCIKAGKVVKAA